MTRQSPLPEAVRGLVAALQARLGDAVEVHDEPLGGFACLTLEARRTAGCPVTLLVDEHEVGPPHGVRAVRPEAVTAGSGPPAGTGG